MLENNRLKPYFLQIDLENMILAAKNVRIVSLVGITLEFRTGPPFFWGSRICSSPLTPYILPLAGPNANGETDAYHAPVLHKTKKAHNTE